MHYLVHVQHVVPINIKCTCYWNFFFSSKRCRGMQRLLRPAPRIPLASADPSECAVQGVSLRPLACWDCKFEFRRGHRRLSLVSVECCQVEVSTSD